MNESPLYNIKQGFYLHLSKYLYNGRYILTAVHYANLNQLHMQTNSNVLT